MARLIHFEVSSVRQRAEGDVWGAVSELNLTIPDLWSRNYSIKIVVAFKYELVVYLCR